MPEPALPELEVAIERLPHGLGLPLPSYATPGSAGLDLLAANPADAPIALAPLARALVPTGIRIALSSGLEAQVRPRSGLALKDGLVVLNSPGTIDSDYRGEIGVILVNLGAEMFTVRRGLRIAQLVVAPVTRIVWHETELEPTQDGRGCGGFGSTGPGG